MGSLSWPRRRFIRALVLMVLIPSVTAGCAWTSRLNPFDDSTSAPEPAAESAADSTVSELPPPSPEETVGPVPTLEPVPPPAEEIEPGVGGDAAEGRGEPATADPPPATEPESVVPAPSDTTAASSGEPGEIRVEISGEEREELLAQIEDDLSAARAAIFAVGGSGAAESDQAERVETLEQYVRLANEALESGDLRGASSLASKARLLADRIHPR